MSTVKIEKINRKITWGAKDKKTNNLKPSFENCRDVIAPLINIQTGKKYTELALDKTELRALEKSAQLAVNDLEPDSKFWDNFSIKIENGVAHLNDENPLHKIQIELLKQQPIVAVGQDALAIKPNAIYVLTSLKEEAVGRNTKRKVITEAHSILAKLSKQDTEDMLYLMDNKRPDITDFDVLEDRLADLMEANPQKFIDFRKDKAFDVKVLIYKCLTFGVIKRSSAGRGLEMPLLFKDIHLGTGIDEVAAFMTATENNATVIAIKKDLEKKQKL